MFYKNFYMKIFCVLTMQLVIPVIGAREPPMVTIPGQGTLMGLYMKMFRIQRIVAYLGIPYAQPPTNEKRFTPPLVDNLASWDGIRNATTLPPECWSDTRKPSKKHEEAFMKLIGLPKRKDTSQYDEDCLYLNIYIPDDPPPPDGYAVIVWLHSGDFAVGNASELSPFHLVFKQKLIVVTVAYRLGIFGFFTSIDFAAPGNFGLMDQSAALLWLSRNIKLFGGNEKSITLMGHGSGAISASLHLTSGDWSMELFHKAIIMSGTSLSATSVREPRSYAGSLDQLASAFGCFRRPTVDLLGCLRRVDAQILLENSPVLDWGPVIDEGLSNTTTPFVSGNPRMLLERGKVQKVPVMIGFTDMEESLDEIFSLEEGISSEMYDTLIGDVVLNELSSLESNESCGSNSQLVLDAVNFAYKPYPPVTDPLELRNKFISFTTERNFAAPSVYLATHMSKMSATYVYKFDIKPKTVAANEGLPMWAGVPHRYDLIFVWGMPYWIPLENQTQWDNADKRVSDIIMTLWSNFAKSSDPTKLGVYIKWDPFTPQNQGVLIIDRSFNMSDSTSLNYNAMQFWNDYYPKVLDIAMQCCNATDSGYSLHTSVKNESSAVIVLFVSMLFIYQTVYLST